MKICKDGRIWGQNNKGAGEHLGILTKGGSCNYIKRGITHSKSVRGNKNPNYGNHSSSKARRKAGKARRGNKHWNWRGGISSITIIIKSRVEYRLWREAVFARDNWTCRECGRQGGRLNAHHIKSFKEYPELRYAIDNGKTLCLDCHRLTENYGKGVSLE